MRCHSRRMLSRAWGEKVGAAFTLSTARLACVARRRSSSCAESSFFPPCRAISTEKDSPFLPRTLSAMARSASAW